ncbi:unnamed protein product [Phyllotreta striolata]|uniref:Ionotropic glutamate receptor C-terminal domain-containing protein n=1 Tax=Phyllotreta striolata TaxID=444603 RepID=A0A9N9U1V7_PHYSR|nr:unnamed protein product [Phyllotreta striolata]
MRACMVILFLSTGLALDPKFVFLKDFFRKKNVPITLVTCPDFKNVTIEAFLSSRTHLDNSMGFQFYGNRPQIIFNSANHRNWHVIDLIFCGKSSDFLFQMNEINAFRFPFKHLILIDISSFDTILLSVCKCDVSIGSEVLLAIFNETTAEIFETYKFRTTSKCNVLPYGNWSEKNGITYTTQGASLFQRRRNFQREELVVNAVIKSNKSLQVDFDDIPEATFDEPYFLESAASLTYALTYLNASYSFRVYTVFGHLNHTTGKFYGMISDLAKGIGDITGSALYLSLERLVVVDLVGNQRSYGTKFVLKEPSMSYVENIYLMTFTDGVWLASGLVLVIFCFILFVVINLEGFKKKNGSGKGRKFTISDAVLLSLEALCQQGTSVDSKTIAGRILLVFLFMVFMFLYAAYAGYILVLLQSTKPIGSVKHLLDSRLECGGVNVSFLTDWYLVNNDPVLKELYLKKLKNVGLLSLEKGLSRVREGNFAFHTALNIAYIHIHKTFTDDEICKLQELPGYLNTDLYYVVPKRSQHKEFFKVSILRINELGFQSRNQYRSSKKPKCYNSIGNFVPVGFYDCYTIIELFFIGTFLSLIIFIVELGTDKWMRSLKMKRFN